MNRKARRFTPQTDGMESRLLLSLTASPPPEGAEVSILSDRGASAQAVNTVQGRYFAAEDNRAADAPLHVELNGRGRVNGLGRARLTGSLDLGGFRIAGTNDVSGTVKFAGPRGTVTLRLTGSGGFEDVPGGRFVTSATVVKGTGAYQGLQRSGTVTFQFGPNQVQAIRAPSPIGGAMTVSIDLKPTAK